MARISGKLTAKSLGWDRNTIGLAVSKVPANGGRVLIGRIVGIVNGIHQTVNDDTGEVQTGLKGSFKGVSAMNETIDDKDTGKPITVTAGRCYLPGGLQEMIESAYTAATKDDEKATVNFGLDLYALPSAGKAGYTYDGETLVEATEADPLEMLLDMAHKTKPHSHAPALIEVSAEHAEKAPEKTAKK